MPSSRLFWKLLLACVGLSFVAVVVFGLILSDQLQYQIVKQVDRRMRDTAELLSAEFSEHLQSAPNEALQQRVRKLGIDTNTRFTLIGADGSVLADSDEKTLADVLAMGDHRDRPEIVQARTRGDGHSVRPSTTLGAPHRYFALRVDIDGKPAGYVRSSFSMEEIVAETAAVRRWTWGLVAAVCLCLFGAAYWILGRILQPLAMLTDAADAIAAGNYEHRVYVDNRDELGVLARTFSRISQDLHTSSTQVGQTLRRQSTVLGGMIEGVIAVDRRERIVLANAAAGRLFAFAAPLAEGRPLLEIIRNHSVHDAVKASIASGEPQRVEVKSNAQQSTAGGQRIDIHIQPLVGQPCPGAVLVMHDMTELRRLESLRRDFIANVSHELKTPLSSIKAYAETLLNGALNDSETAQRFLARIEEQADRLNRLINDMLTLARIESEQQPLEIVPVD
jgi:two-component system phosphate regulon sensor histidine kinase PhoR